jgi:hypothetical protein
MLPLLSIWFAVCCLTAEQEELRKDPFYTLEYGGEDKRKAAAARPALEHLIGMQEERNDDYALNKALRRQLRVLCDDPNLERAYYNLNL